MLRVIAQNQAGPVPTANAATGNQSPRSQGSTRHTSIAAAPPSHAVTMLASQIPEYGGSEEENVQLWIQRVEQVARIHRAPDDIVFLAASTKLVKTARRWFDMGSGPMIESWAGFREAVLKRFTRKILFHVAIQKVEARKWNFTSLFWNTPWTN
ncbi:hypothetical protein X777_16556 [Ooceraea biroi]|uniref:Retrotransposon gag domain-containing protein n=1 Tax=Ooceraea biroi TaxID=2015173 RepID=A0A026VTX7_OOCBI|nr:hypothetical protein X777_16556 [Ooceraea biroi]